MCICARFVVFDVFVALLICLLAVGLVCLLGFGWLVIKVCLRNMGSSFGGCWAGCCLGVIRCDIYLMML